MVEFLKLVAVLCIQLFMCLRGGRKPELYLWAMHKGVEASANSRSYEDQEEKQNRATGFSSQSTDTYLDF